MVCPVCRCPGAPCVPFVPAGEVPEVFDVILDEYCFRRMYIPCNVRGFLANYIEEHRNVATTFKHKSTEPAILTYESRSYASDFKHRSNYSKFCGSAWFEFSNDYALRAGDRVVFILDNSCFDLKVETFRDGERILPLPSVAVMPRGLEFNYHNNRLFVRSLFRTSSFVRCIPFVHVTTATNTVKFLMKIPKAVVCSLRRFVDMPVTARISLEAYMGDTHVIMPSSFKLCKQDGRMVIEKISFSEFISATSYEKDNVVLITFNESTYDRSVSIVFQWLL
ncbi:hypothetical protein CFC21_091968 [Triticum aestivum]|uniref:TF-B3 domain-containing protein n=2 Tax=Triticum aestivum TaxID=4565 RepID=A0A9R1LHF3_WHEAT|nr:hypothetical protein CFC21_091968 [Triticum aestivum]